MVSFPNIQNQWFTITQRTIECEETFNGYLALKGRGIALAQTLKTPIKVVSELSKLVLSIVEIATIIFAVITLKASSETLYQAGANILDVTAGAALLPIATVVHLVRGLAGIIIHPKCMIKKVDFILAGTQNSYLYGTLVNC